MTGVLFLAGVVVGGFAVLAGAMHGRVSQPGKLGRSGNSAELPGNSARRTPAGDVHYARCHGTECPCFKEGRLVELVKRRDNALGILARLGGRR